MGTFVIFVSLKDEQEAVLLHCKCKMVCFLWVKVMKLPGWIYSPCEQSSQPESKCNEKRPPTLEGVCLYKRVSQGVCNFQV